MIEIIIGIILQITTILNGGASDKEAANKKAEQTKAKTEQPSTSSTAPADGGSGTWNDD